MVGKYLNKVILFYSGTGCIPERSVCYCFAIELPFLHVHFEREVLGRHDFKIHIDVIENNARVT